MLRSNAVFKGCLEIAVSNEQLDKGFSLDELTVHAFDASITNHFLIFFFFDNY